MTLKYAMPKGLHVYADGSWQGLDLAKIERLMAAVPIAGVCVRGPSQRGRGPGADMAQPRPTKRQIEWARSAREQLGLSVGFFRWPVPLTDGHDRDNPIHEAGEDWADKLGAEYVVDDCEPEWFGMHRDAEEFTSAAMAGIGQEIPVIVSILRNWRPSVVPVEAFAQAHGINVQGYCNSPSDGLVRRGKKGNRVLVNGEQNLEQYAAQVVQWVEESLKQSTPDVSVAVRAYRAGAERRAKIAWDDARVRRYLATAPRRSLAFVWSLRQLMAWTGTWNAFGAWWRGELEGEPTLSLPY